MIGEIKPLASDFCENYWWCTLVRQGSSKHSTAVDSHMLLEHTLKCKSLTWTGLYMHQLYLCSGSYGPLLHNSSRMGRSISDYEVCQQVWLVSQAVLGCTRLIIYLDRAENNFRCQKGWPKLTLPKANWLINKLLGPPISHGCFQLEIWAQKNARLFELASGMVLSVDYQAQVLQGGIRKNG